MVIKRSAKQRTQLKGVNVDKKHRALQHAWRLSPYIAAWEAEGLSQRQLVTALNDAGAVVPSEYTGEPYCPEPHKKWTLVQVQRLLKNIPIIKEKMAYAAKRKGVGTVPVYGDGAGLFVHPERALNARGEQAVNKSRPFDPAGFPRRWERAQALAEASEQMPEVNAPRGTEERVVQHLARSRWLTMHGPSPATEDEEDAYRTFYAEKKLAELDQKELKQRILAQRERMGNTYTEITHKDLLAAVPIQRGAYVTTDRITGKVVSNDPWSEDDLYATADFQNWLAEYRKTSPTPPEPEYVPKPVSLTRSRPAPQPAGPLKPARRQPRVLAVKPEGFLKKSG
jgi:hypothetical protein